jgi:hypothetical protein
MRSALPIHNPGLLVAATFDDNMHMDKSGNNNVFTVGSAVVLQAGPLKPFAKSNARKWM